MTIDDLLDGHSPTATWLGTEQAQRILADPWRRVGLYCLIHVRPERAHRPLLLSLLAQEVEFRRRTDDEPIADDEPEDAFENLYWCALLLFQIGDVRDALPLWRAKMTSFDTATGLEVQFLVGAGLDATLAFLAGSDDPDAMPLAEYLSEAAANGELEELAEWLEWRRGYFETLAVDRALR